jgi:hypothetical protein
LLRGAAPHEVAVVAATVVISVQPGVGFGLELADGAEPATVERGSPAFLQGGALEAFAHRVVVRAAGRDPMMHETELGEVVTEPQGDVFGTVIRQHGPHRPAEPPVTGPSTIWRNAHRVAVSTAVSWYTFPTPLRWPM